MKKDKRKAVSISDIAEKTSLSIATVSRALNYKDNISEETRKKVFSAANELGYPIYATAQKTSFVLVSIPTTNELVYDPFVSGIYDSLLKHELIPVIMHSNKDIQLEKKFYRMAITENFCGAILVSPKTAPEDVKLLSEAMPTIQCFDSVTIPNETVIQMDDEKAAFEATNYLIEKGHKRIGLLKCDESSSSQIRQNGYIRALNYANIPVDNSIIYEIPYEFEKSHDSVVALLEQREKFDALLCVGTYMAYRVLYEAGSKGIQIPDDLSVVGFDDIYLNEAFNPGLTVVLQNGYSIGFYAGILLLNQQDTAVVRNTGMISNINYKIIERNSVKDRTKKHI